MNKILGWLLIVLALVVLFLFVFYFNGSPLWPISNIADIVVFGWAGYSVLKTKKTLAWFLLAAPILIIIALVAQNSVLFMLLNTYIIVVGLVGGYLLLKKPA